MKITQKIKTYLLGFIIGFIALCALEEIDIWGIYSTRARTDGIFVKIAPLRHQIVEHLIFGEIIPSQKLTESYFASVNADKKLVDDFIIYPNGDIFFHTKENQLVLCATDHDAPDERGYINSVIWWNCYGAPQKTVPAIR